MCDFIHPVSSKDKWAKFANMVLVTFPAAKCQPPEKRFLNDGDPSQNSTLVSQALKEIGAIEFSNLPNSSYFNSIENIQVPSMELKTDTIKKHMEEHVRWMTADFSFSEIHRIIGNMHEHISLVMNA